MSTVFENHLIFEGDIFEWLDEQLCMAVESTYQKCCKNVRLDTIKRFKRSFLMF